MKDLYLSFTDEGQALPILYTYVPPTFQLDENGNPTTVQLTEGFYQQNYKNMEIIGTVYQKTPIPTPPDYQPIPYPPPNWGVNILLLDDEDGEALKPYLCFPKKPVRVWA
jgi:hypothetical protein